MEADCLEFEEQHWTQFVLFLLCKNKTKGRDLLRVWSLKVSGQAVSWLLAQNTKSSAPVSFINTCLLNITTFSFGVFFFHKSM